MLHNRRQTATVLGLRPDPRYRDSTLRDCPHKATRKHYNSLIYKEKERAGRKPGSVEDNHSSGTAVADCLMQPTREPAQARSWSRGPACSPIWSCSRRGLPCRGVLPPARCALTAPFHPYRIAPAVYFLWHFPWARALQALPGALPDGARTFLHRPLRGCGDCLADSHFLIPKREPESYRIRPYRIRIYPPSGPAFAGTRPCGYRQKCR